MDVTSLVQQLKAERPALVPALQSALKNCSDREALNTVLEHLLQMQDLLHRKRETAKDMLLVKTGIVGGPTMALRHIPDVQIRAFCQIAEIEHYTSASTEWLDMMVQREIERGLTQYERRPE